MQAGSTANAKVHAARRPAVAWRRALLAIALALPAAAWSSQASPDDPVDAVVAMADKGEFARARAAIAAALADPALPAARHAALAFEAERMRRIGLDFSLDRAAAMERVRRQVPDLTPDEFDRWDAAGLLERMTIDGQVRYFNRAPSNLFRLDAGARARRAKQAPFVEGPMESPNAHHREVLAQSRAEPGQTSFAPRRIRVTQSLTVKPDAVPAGETVRAWLPFPRDIPGQQEHIVLVASEPAGARLAPATTLQRTAYLEQPARAGKPVAFSVTYDVTLHARRVEVDPARVVPVVATPGLAAHLGERAPHIVFTDALRAFSRGVVGNETDPWKVANLLFDAVDRIPWAGAREYSTIRNISDYALHAGHADCGQQTLLLMALLRLNGIPARWQSGMVWSDTGYWNLHDWGWMYIAPHGWLPMDVTTGRMTDPDPGVAGFYLGGLDAYRIAFNDDYGRDFVPAKQHLRSETVDLQRGEAEWRGGNLYFDQWDYDFSWRQPAPDHQQGNTP